MMEECCLSNLTINTYCVRVEVFTAVTVKITVFWYVTPSCLVDHYKSFEETSCLHLQDPRLLLLLSSSSGGGGGNLHHHHRENISPTQLLPVWRLISLMQSHTGNKSPFAPSVTIRTDEHKQ
jgi:hypothetical protein